MTRLLIYYRNNKRQFGLLEVHIYENYSNYIIVFKPGFILDSLVKGVPFILKDISNDEGSTNYNNIPVTPKKRNKKNIIPDLERQNTIKCITKLKISPLAFNNQNKGIKRLRTSLTKLDVKAISARDKSTENLSENNSGCLIM